MVCAGKSQNSKHHHLNLYKGQVWSEKSYFELCNRNILSVEYYDSANFPREYMHNGELSIPQEIFWWMYAATDIGDLMRVTTWDIELLDSFAQLTNITFFEFEPPESSTQLKTYHLGIGSTLCFGYLYTKCVPPHSYQYVKLESLFLKG